MKKIVYILTVAVLFISCDNTEKRARERVARAASMIEAGELNGAKIELDSVHILYPREVAVRREAKYLQDSIIFIEAQRTLAYSDSLLQPLFPQVDDLMKHFKHEKQEKYEDNERYVHQLLPTNRNAQRCFLQCYVNSVFELTLKSYYYGQTEIRHEDVEISNGTVEVRESGHLHSFEAEGWHEITTLSEKESLTLLAFVSQYKTSRLRVTLYGRRGRYAYYLQDSEKTALEETYQLAVLMKDIHRLEQQMNIARKQIERWQTRKS